jgi:hypothetical protein
MMLNDFLAAAEALRSSKESSFFFLKSKKHQPAGRVEKPLVLVKNRLPVTG